MGDILQAAYDHYVECDGILRDMTLGEALADQDRVADLFNSMDAEKRLMCELGY